jgi:hypothetical protein
MTLNKKYTHISYKLFISIISLILITSCKEWTEVESLEIENPSIEKQNPALYAAYLDDLRAYKNSPHKIAIGWYDNSVKKVFNQAQHIDKVPDSLDFLVLNYPANLVERELNEIKAIKHDKNTKTIYEINYDAIKGYYELNEAELALGDYASYLTDTVKKLLLLSSIYNYDGMIVGYTGKNLTHLTEDEKTVHTANETLFISLIKEWRAANTTKHFMFKGYPQYLLDNTILSDFDYIILPTAQALSKSNLTFELLSATVAGVPMDRFIVLANSTSYKADETSLGYFSDGSRSVTGTAGWVTAIENGLTIQGLGIINVQYDYFNLIKVYQYTREAITTMNPVIK